MRKGAVELQKFRANFPDIDFDYPETNRFQEKLAQIEDQQAKTLLEMSDILNLIHNIESKLNKGISYQSIPHFRNDNVIQNLSAKLSDLSVQLAAAKTRYGQKFPTRMSLEKEIADMSASLKAEISRSIESLRNQAGILESTLERLDETETVLMERRQLKIKLQTEFDQRKSNHNQKKNQRDRLIQMIQELSMESP
ncbi:MAG TPA: hypothetical protein EYQ50_29780 [Verrucomicrobiales bacterium]|nr:hypothetical protein [Verrucomicrobiales bacterium]